MRHRTRATPAVFLADRLVPERQPRSGVLLELPHPVDGPFPLARHTLLLPQPTLAALDLAAPPGLEALAQPWVRSKHLSLWVPSTVDDEARLERAHDITLVATPGSVLVGFPADALTRVAWRALTRFPPDLVAAVAAQLALTWEQRYIRSPEQPTLRLLRLPPDALSRLHGRVAAGDVLLDPRCLRWIVAEAAAAAASGRWASPPALPTDDVAERVFFAQLLGASAPGTAVDLLTALWLLHDGFHAEPDSDDVDALSITALLGFHSAYRPFRWVDALDRARRCWSVDGRSGALTRARPSPSELVAAVTSDIGFTPLQWLAGVFLTGALISQRLLRDGALRLRDADFRAGPLEEIDPSFWCALREQLVVRFDELGNRIVAGARRYEGLGTLTDRDAQTLRHQPAIELWGSLFVCGLDQLAFAGIEALRRSARGAHKDANSTLGRMLEAAALERLGDLGPRHRLVSPDLIDSVVPRDQPRCDVIVVDDRHWLLIELGSQRPRAGELFGRREAVVERCRQYHAKLDQAEATRRHLGAIAVAAGIAPPLDVTALVVTGEMIMPTDALLSQLQRERAGRQPRFVATFEDLDELVHLGKAWSAPSLVRSWQERHEYASLGAHLAATGRWWRSPSRIDLAAVWEPLLPRLRPDAA